MARLILFNKPYRVLSQFTDGRGRDTLADFIHQPGFYAAGRLDFDSEGLLLLCDDGRLQQRISNPRNRLEKTYLAQVEGVISSAALAQLASGIVLQDGPTRPARAQAVAPPDLWPRDPPIRLRESIPTSWVELVISEGRNRQVRRMLAHVGFPVLRLVRTAIGDWRLAGLAPGESRDETIHLPRPGATRRGSRRPPAVARRPGRNPGTSH